MESAGKLRSNVAALPDPAVKFATVPFNACVGASLYLRPQFPLPLAPRSYSLPRRVDRFLVSLRRTETGGAGDASQTARVDVALIDLELGPAHVSSKARVRAH